MNTPKTIEEYLQQLHRALAGADPALIQDALYDAEEHLRSELAENPHETELAMLERVAGSYGAPEEVADIYRDTEVRVQRALHPPSVTRTHRGIGRFFAVAADPHTYGALFYMLLALATGVFYFTWVVTGTSLSLGMAILIIGIPFVILFLGSVRILALVEGRIVETMLGVRMPRRLAPARRDMTILRRIGAMFTDPRTWGSLFYMLLMLPLGVIYFTLIVSGLSFAFSLAFGPLLGALFDANLFQIDMGSIHYVPSLWVAPFLFVLGVLLFFVMLHLARAIGRLHGEIAKRLLVKTIRY